MMPRAATALLLSVLVCGCSGPLVNIAPVPPGEYSEEGVVKGEACGFLLLGMLPLGVNDRAERAYDRALKSVRATSLTETSVNESWYFTPLGPAVCTGIEGTALVRSATTTPQQTPPRAEMREVPKSLR